MLGPATVSEVMDEAVTTIGPDASVLDAVGRLHGGDIGSVVVVDDGRVVGIVTESDVVAVVADGRDPASCPVGECMSAPVHTVPPDATVVEAARRLRDNRIKKLPVCADGELVGIVTTTDLANYLPHVQHRRPDRNGDDERVRQTDREDTAYESDDWSFEYIGHEETIDVGDRVRFSKTLDRAEVEAVADASGDTNRLHLDEAYAEATRFGRRIVHGTLVSGTISAALARLPGLIIYLSQELSYLGPVDIGERVTAECEVVEEVDDARFRLATTVADSDGETVIDGEAVVLADPVPDTA
ncbi:acyl dehydratase [Halobacteriales archaeon QS_4_69_31]|nr:MAG: acyl dehydratase [Halobacteriales archaeon QS_4_69_31]